MKEMRDSYSRKKTISVFLSLFFALFIFLASASLTLAGCNCPGSDCDRCGCTGITWDNSSGCSGVTNPYPNCSQCGGSGTPDCPATAPSVTNASCVYNSAAKGFNITWTAPNLAGGGIDTARYEVSRFVMATWKGNQADNPTDYTNTYPTDNGKWSKYLCVDHIIPSGNISYPIPNAAASAWAKNWPNLPSKTDTWPGRCDWKLDTDLTTVTGGTSTMSWRPAYGIGVYSGTINYVLKDKLVSSDQAERCKTATTITSATFTCTVPTDYAAYNMKCDMTTSGLVQSPNWNGERQYWLVQGNNYANALTITGKLNTVNNLFNLNFWRSPVTCPQAPTGGCWYGKPTPIPGYENETILTTRTDPHIKSLSTGINLTNPASVTPGRYYIVCNSTLNNENKCSGNPFIPSYPSNGYQDCGGTNSRVVVNIVCMGKDHGDATCGNGINVADYNAWRAEYLNPPADKTADFDGNEAITLKDYEIWRQNTTNFN